jgi:phosphonate transport system substrate-binding protein
MMGRTLRFASFLAPNMLLAYQYIARRVGEKLRVATDLFVGESYEQLGQADVSFVCGLAYIEMAGPGKLDLEAIAAPVLAGPRYGAKPVYFSDVVVRGDSPVHTFADLRGRSWAFNEPLSHSGYGIVRYHLVGLGQTDGFFGKVVQTGWHERSIELILAGKVDASAIDSHVLALGLRDRPEWAANLRVIATLGPSTIQPVVAARYLAPDIRVAIREALVALADDGVDREILCQNLLDGFVPIGDADYDDLRHMRAACLRAGFPKVR